MHLGSNAEQGYTTGWLSSVSSLMIEGSTKVLEITETQAWVSGVPYGDFI